MRSGPQLLGVGVICDATTKVNVPATMTMIEGRELANQQLMDDIPKKEIHLLHFDELSERSRWTVCCTG